MSENQPTPESPNPAQTPSAPPDSPPPDPAALAEGDPEIAALLEFEPVVRKCKRRDGWTVERQRGFIAALARGGDVDKAAHAVGRTSGGAWKLRSAGDGESFAAAWDGAIDLFHARNPGTSRRGGRARGAWAPPPPPAPARAGRGIPMRHDPPPPPEIEGSEKAEFFEALLVKYLHKLREERMCRLDGRIVAADFCVRQLTWLEVVLDLGGMAMELLSLLKRGGVGVLDIVETPMSLLLGEARRAYWMEKGEADRPPQAPLGRHDDRLSTGEAEDYNAERDGDFKQWCRRQDGRRRAAAKAQAAWEEKAKAEAGAWAKRLEEEADGGEGGAEPAP